MTRLQHKRELIKLLAEYISSDAAKKSILLEMKDPDATLWAKIRQAANVFGWLSVEDTEKQLKDLLG